MMIKLIAKVQETERNDKQVYNIESPVTLKKLPDKEVSINYKATNGTKISILIPELQLRQILELGV